MQGQHPRRSRADGVEDAGRDQREGVVDMYYGGPEAFHRPADRPRHPGVPGGGQRAPYRAPGALSADLVAVAGEGFDRVAVRAQQCQLGGEDLIFAGRGGGAVVVMDEEDFQHGCRASLVLGILVSYPILP